MKYLMPLIFVSLSSVMTAYAEDVDSEKVKKEYSSCMKGLSEETLNDQNKKLCQVYKRAYEGGHTIGHTIGFEEGKSEGLGWRGMTDLTQRILVRRPSVSGHEGIEYMIVPQNVTNSETTTVGLKDIMIDQSALGAANLTIKQLPSGNYVLTNE